MDFKSNFLKDVLRPPHVAGIPLLALQLQVGGRGDAVPGVAGCHDQVDHRLHLRHLLRLDEFHHSQLALQKHAGVDGYSWRDSRPPLTGY